MGGKLRRISVYIRRRVGGSGRRIIVGPQSWSLVEILLEICHHCLFFLEPFL
jgi:hypothetical protein